MCIWCLFTIQFRLVILSQISAACSEWWYWKLEFCVTSFWFNYHRLWWSSWQLHYFSYKYFWFEYLVGVTCSKSEELTLVCSLHNFCSVHNIWASHTLLYLLRLVCCIVGITLCRFASHSLHQKLVWVALTRAKLAMRTVIMPFHRWLSLLLRLKVVSSI